MKYTIQGYCNLRRVNYQQFKLDMKPSADPKNFEKEVYEKKDIEALLAQPGAIAVRPVKMVLTGRNRNLIAAVKKNGGQPSGGDEHDNMLKLTHIIALPKKQAN